MLIISLINSKALSYVVFIIVYESMSPRLTNSMNGTKAVDDVNVTYTVKQMFEQHCGASMPTVLQATECQREYTVKRLVSVALSALYVPTKDFKR